MPEAVPCAWNNISDPEERGRWDAAVQEALRPHADTVSDYSVAAAPHGGTVEVRLTLPGSPPRYLALDVTAANHSSERITQVVRDLLSAAGL